MFDNCLKPIVVPINNYQIKYKELTFEVFYRGNDISDASGLGLYIVNQTVEKLNASINMKSEVGKGTTITLFLPSTKKPDAKQQVFL